MTRRAWDKRQVAPVKSKVKNWTRAIFSRRGKSGAKSPKSGGKPGGA